ncbi:MAG: hypothetical protein P8Y95_00090 [Gammaproteobacteria bacterium]
MKHRQAILLAATVAWSAAASLSHAAVDTDALLSEAAAALDIDLAAEHERIISGEMITAVGGELEIDEAQLGAAQLMYLPVSLDAVSERLGRVAKFHRNAVEAQKLIDANDAVNIVTLDEQKAKRLREAEPGDPLNFSGPEFQQLRTSDDVADTLNDILTARYRAYRRRGLNGIEPYLRDNDEVFNVSVVLQESIHEGDITDKYFHEFRAAALHYPTAGTDLSHRFFAVEREMDDRPQYLLTHWIIDRADNYVLVLQRQFYVNHTYQTLQIIFVCAPYHEGVVMIMLNQTFTEKVEGFGSGIAHEIGRERLAETIAETFEDIKASLL